MVEGVRTVLGAVPLPHGPLADHTWGADQVLGIPHTAAAAGHTEEGADHTPGVVGVVEGMLSYSHVGQTPVVVGVVEGVQTPGVELQTPGVELHTPGVPRQGLQTVVVVVVDHILRIEVAAVPKTWRFAMMFQSFTQ